MRLGLLSLPSNFHCRKWALALQKAGAEVCVFSFEQDKIDGIETVYIQPSLVWNGRYRYPSYWLASRALREVLAKKRIEVLHPLHLTPFGTWAVMSGFRPIVSAAIGSDVLEYVPELQKELTHRNWRNPEIEQNYTDILSEKIRRSFYACQVRKVIKHSDLILPDNQFIYDALTAHFRTPVSKLRLLSWGLEPSAFEQKETTICGVMNSLGLNEAQKIILSPRGLRAFYHADIILDAIANLAENLDKSTFVVMLGAGYGLADSLKKRAKELSARYPNIVLIEKQLNSQEMACLWLRTSIFISAPVYDGYSASLAEGRFVGAIPIVNDIPANREIITQGYNGLYANPFNSANLTKVIAYALNQLNELQPAFAKVNREWIVQNSLLTTSAKRFLEICKDVLKNRGDTLL